MPRLSRISLDFGPENPYCVRVILKAVTFVVDGNLAEGYFFYNSPYDSGDGHIHGMIDLTLPKAIAKMQALGLDPIKNFKMNIAVYYYP